MFALHTKKDTENKPDSIKMVKCEKTGTIFYEKNGRQAWSKNKLIKSAAKAKK